MNDLMVRVTGDVLGVRSLKTRSGKELHEIHVYDGTQLWRVMAVELNGTSPGKKFEGTVRISADRDRLRCWLA